MKTPFFITGLPRSRTAWLANWVSTGNTLCYHDVKYSKQLVEAAGEMQTGFSGPETAGDFDKAKEEFPDARWLVITRNSKEAFAAFKAWGGNDLPTDPKWLDDFWKNRCALLGEICVHQYCEIVSVNGLDSEDMARRVWSHLGIEEPFRVSRWHMLRVLNVQQDKEKAKKLWPLAR